jgi:hypothetical protein
MSSFNKIYREATSGLGASEISPDGIIGDNEISKDLNEDAARRQAKHQWLASQITQEHLQQLSIEANSLIDMAIKLSEGYHAHQNHYQIISNLLRANELRKIIQQQNK